MTVFVVDPVLRDMSNPQRLNRYGYVRNNPINLVDRNGMNEMIPEGVIIDGCTDVWWSDNGFIPFNFSNCTYSSEPWISSSGQEIGTSGAGSGGSTTENIDGIEFQIDAQLAKLAFKLH